MNTASLRTILDQAILDFKSAYKNKSLEAFDSFERDLMWLFQDVLGLNQAQIIISFDLELDADKAKIIKALIDRRMAGEPLQYILQHVQFGGLELFVDPRVLIPRDDTEQWCQWAEQKIKSVKDCESFWALDLCTGSGAIALFFAKRFPSSHFIASDISQQALEVAQINKQKSNLKNVKLAQGDLFSGIESNQKFDIIFSNPPYISQSLYERLDRSVKDFEPENALVADDQGLEFYCKIFNSAPEFLTTKNGFGWIFFEYDQYTRSGVHSLAIDNGFSLLEEFLDLSGKPRAALYQLNFFAQAIY